MRKGGHLLQTQQDAVLKMVDAHRRDGRTVGEIVQTLGIGRSTYYRWKQSRGRAPSRPGFWSRLTPHETQRIEEIQAAHPALRHRQLQGLLQAQGVSLSWSALYKHLKALNRIEPYARRSAPWAFPRYEVWRKNLMWGCDWTKLRIGSLRWYLVTVMDFFSRLIVAFEVVPTVNAAHVKAIYRKGLLAQDIPLAAVRKPELRVDQGSPNTSRVTQDFFDAVGAALSFSRVRRPTDNAITERFYGTIKQEEIYLVGQYPDEQSAREELGQYITYYNTQRPHQALMNFSPAYVHQVNNKTALVTELKALKKRAREARKQYWITLKNQTH